LLRKDGGEPLLHPLSPCPMYDVGGNEAGSGRYALFIHNHDGHYKNYGPTDTSFHRRPVYLVPGHFKADADQPVWFDEPKLFMDHDGVSLGKPRTNGRLDLALYSSLTLVNGRPVLWYPERKFFLLGRIIGKEWFAGHSALHVNPEPQQGNATKPRVTPGQGEIVITSEIADTVAIARSDDRAWLVTQQRMRDEGPVGSRPHDYAQAPTWLKIHNPGATRAISVVLLWIDFGYMAYRKWGYLKHADTYVLLTGQISPGKTAYRFDAPPGTSWFGPVPHSATRPSAPSSASSNCRGRAASPMTFAHKAWRPFAPP
jgi:hypothetical protein